MCLCPQPHPQDSGAENGLSTAQSFCWQPFESPKAEVHRLDQLGYSRSGAMVWVVVVMMVVVGINSQPSYSNS